MSDVEDIYKKYVTFTSGGSYPNKMGFCPIHGEIPGKSKPSFCVDMQTGSWICFAGCGGGGIPQFLKVMGETDHNIKDAVKDVKIVKKKKLKRRSQTETIPKKVLGLFDYCPLELIKAGFEEEVLMYHDIGYDNEKCRITYPVFNRLGNLVAVVGRRPNSQFGKYIPYTEKEFKSLGIEEIPKYDKGSVFWREDKFFQTNGCHDRSEPVILVEGFKAALWLVQHGYNNVMALMGTYVTSYHKQVLESLGKTVILCLDGDKPGIISTIKNGYKLNDTLKVLTCQYIGGKTQPDDLTETQLHDMLSKPISIQKYKKIKKEIINYERRN